MLQTLREFQSNHSVDHLRILVVGPEGVGKSAFITSVNTVLQGRNTSLTGSYSAINKYTICKLKKSTEGSLFPFVFGDTVGLKKKSNQDIVNILQGHVPEGSTINPSMDLTVESTDFNQTPSLNDEVHCLVLIMKECKYIFKEVKQVLEKACRLGIPVVVLMSKVDEACPLVKQNLKMIYRSKKIKETMEKCSVSLGVPLKYIFPVKNYHEEITNSAEIDILILMALTNILNFANDFVEASEKLWRTVNWRDREPMLQTLREFQSNHSVDHLRILVVGPEGVGKSAFITSVNTALQGRNTYLAHSLTGGSSVTNKYTVYKLNKSTEGSFFPFVFGDTMGLKTGLNDAQTNDIVNILHGHVREGYTFDPSKALTSESKSFNQTPSLNDKVHCLVFVLPADTIDNMPEEIITKMKQVLVIAHELKIPVVVLMSKVDAACPLVKENLKMIYRSMKIKERMEKCSVSLGVPLNYIFPVKNYHEEITNSAEIDILILMALINILNFANEFVERTE
ncbi:hypothetical protein AMELA_G00234090 [Ameiurus melas]|uniref:Interferon-induced protein 44-like protein n=1 Tax=Ameiurus melas TaxID=219545 RepID=A0A7J5ZXY5_AMEME|nr:hypothetical protein AMELA_G00234090 [Ameiurus melas]